MIPKKHSYVFLLIILSFEFALSQSNNEMAAKLGVEAVKLMDVGEIEKSLELLNRATELDPENIDYPYEIGLAYCKKENFVKSIEIMESIKNHPDANDLVFVQLGNSYDMNGNPEKAFETYQIGMDKFPNSGRFHQELGNIAYSKKEYSKAVSYWVDGLKVNPNYSTNYYKLAKIFSFSDEKIWTLIYGELFVLLEPLTARTEEISKLLFQTYQEIYDEENNYTNIDVLTIKGFQIIEEIHRDPTQANNSQFPFEGVYAYAFLSSSIHFKDKIDFATISKIRKSFLYFWFDGYQFHNIYQNNLFDHQQLMLDNDVFETYTYWLLSQGNREEFQIWFNQNEEKVSQFASWFDRNQFRIEEKDF